MKDVAGIARTALAGLALVFACQAQAQESPLAEARQLYEEGRWTAAWDLLASLADRGDAEAARMVIRMTRFGPQLFRQDWAPAPARMARWRVAALADEPVRTAIND